MPQVPPNEVTRTAPERIWLQISDDEARCDEPFPRGGDTGITWCEDSVEACQVAYVRADLAWAATAPADALTLTDEDRAAIKSMRQDLVWQALQYHERYENIAVHFLNVGAARARPAAAPAHRPECDKQWSKPGVRCDCDIKEGKMKRRDQAAIEREIDAAADECIRRDAAPTAAPVDALATNALLLNDLQWAAKAENVSTWFLREIAGKSAAALLAAQERIAELTAKLERSSSAWTAMNELQAKEWQRAEKAAAIDAAIDRAKGAPSKG